jgi:hypothetical protein
LEAGIVERVATNIKTGDPRFVYITNIKDLLRWLHEDKVPKLYILDEAGFHAYKRKAMTLLNQAILQLLPELSKTHGRLIVIAHSRKVIDQALLDSVWLCAEVKKQSKKTAILASQYLRQKVIPIRNIPRTGVTFDPDAFAVFGLGKEEKPAFRDDQKRKLWDYGVEKKKVRDICHQQEMERLLRQFVYQNRHLLIEPEQKQEENQENSEVTSHNSAEGEVYDSQ